VAGSPIKTLVEAEEACKAMLGYLTRKIDGEEENPAVVNRLASQRHFGSGPTRGDCRTTHAGLNNQTADCKPSARPNRIDVNFVAETRQPLAHVSSFRCAFTSLC
jgi:hypothetical protein